MVAHFYLMPESFAHNDAFTIEEIEAKIVSLSDDITKIEEFKDTNKLYANFENLYKQIFYLNFSVFDFICDPVFVKQTVDRDIVNSFQKIFEKATDTTLSSQEIKDELFEWHNNNECNGIIAFHEIPDIDRAFQIIYNHSGWQRFRAQFLGIYPKDNIFFIEECKKYFPNIFFHENTKITVTKILDKFSKSIINHLEHLNNTFYFYKYRQFLNESVKFQTLTIDCKLEGDAASKDINDAKEYLTFDFTNEKGKNESIVCYAHLRLCKSDILGDSHYYHHRIYFHEGLENIEKGKILVPHIGLHRK